MFRRADVATALFAALIVFFATTIPRAFAQREEVLYNFSTIDNRAHFPDAPLIFDSAGNLYGTTQVGGAYDYGVVFELMPVDGRWTFEVLYSFGNGTDGTAALGTLTFDSSGSLYGTTAQGGAHNAGTVFKLTPQTGGSWDETILHSFDQNGADGSAPEAGVILDASGDIYGTTTAGGSYNLGTVFKLSPASGDIWDESILQSFGSGADGSSPFAGTLIFDTAGNLYGTTLWGGAYQNGSVFELLPASGGSWTEKIIFNFNPNSKEGFQPDWGVISDNAGNLYGTLSFGGAYQEGVVFELSPGSGGLWSEKVLYNFKKNATDGRTPAASLMFDAAGNLYGSTFSGGAYGQGTAFELSPKSGGGWKENVLHSFQLSHSDGYDPFAPFAMDPAGNLYGTTQGGGLNGGGVIFRIKP
jgi:uncharacterized repeat protein (TIGR03803 family)